MNTKSLIAAALACAAVNVVADECECTCGGCCCSGAKTPEICTEEEKAEGFKPLYNGKNLDGWILKGAKNSYRPGNKGQLLYDHTAGGGTLWTDRDYADFVIRFEFLLSSDCNNGLAVRTPLGAHAAFDGMEIQMIDDEGAMYTAAFPQLGVYHKPYQRHGAVYGVIAPKHKSDGKSYLKPAGQWNTQEVSLIGSKIKVTLNGTVIVEDDLSRYPVDGTTADGQKHPGLRNKTGRLGWLSHGYPCRWRKIRIKEIK